MSILFADFPSNDHGLYGADADNMLDGLWAQNANTCVLMSDPDPAIGSAGIVLGAGGGASSKYMRAALPAAHATVGVARRLWMDALPSLTSGLGYKTPRIVTFAKADNTAIATAWVTTTGRIVVSTGSNTSGTIWGETTAPVITANAWWHIETKLVIDAVAGSIEVRVNGVAVINETGLNTGTDSIGQVWVGSAADGSATSSTDYALKDFVLWDGAGSVNNDFIGQCTVFWQRPISTIAAGTWVSNAGATTDETVNKPRLANVLTAAGAIASGNQVRINSTYYNWTSGSVDAGTPAGTSANPWLVAIGVDDAESLENLYAAIGATGTPGTTYSTALTAHTTATPYGLTSTSVTVIPTDGVTTTMTFSETGANTSWLSTSAFQNYVHDSIRMSADAATEFEVSIDPLPDDVTSIRAVIPIVRAAKIDGGDGNIQVSFGISAPSYDAGPDTPITTAFTYWGNPTSPFVSEINPLTATAWAPGDFNVGARVKVARTL